MTPSQLTVEDYRCDCKYRYKCTLQAALIVQVAQLSQRDRATGWVSFGRNISSNPLAISFIAEHRTGCSLLVVAQVHSFSVNSANIAISHIAKN